MIVLGGSMAGTAADEAATGQVGAVMPDLFMGQVSIWVSMTLGR